MSEDNRPDVAKDDDAIPREKMKDSWHRPEETMGDMPASGPDAEKQSRTD